MTTKEIARMGTVPNNTILSLFRVEGTVLKPSEDIDRKTKMPGVNAALILG